MEQTNAADSQQIAEAKRREKRNREQWKDDLRYVLADRRGRRFFWGLLKHCGIFAVSFRGDGFTEFREGARNIGLKLLDDLNVVDPKSYVTMIEEDRKESVI